MPGPVWYVRWPAFGNTWPCMLWGSTGKTWITLNSLQLRLIVEWVSHLIYSSESEFILFSLREEPERFIRSYSALQNRGRMDERRISARHLVYGHVYYKQLLQILLLECHRKVFTDVWSQWNSESFFYENFNQFNLFMRQINRNQMKLYIKYKGGDITHIGNFEVER